MIRSSRRILVVSSAAFAFAGPAFAQNAEEPRRTRVGVGLQVVPEFPGAENSGLRPMGDVSRARGSEEFAFEAPDESFGFTLFRSGKLTLGPAISLQGSRRAEDVGARLPKVGFTVEIGAFAEYSLSEKFRLRSEVRKGVGGHEAWLGSIGADFVSRDADKWLFSVGPRLTITSKKYQQAYFGVSPSASLNTGLPAYDPDGGVAAIGLASGYLREITPRWGIMSFGKYDRLVKDSARSPITRQLGSRNQWAAGLGVTYTFGSAVRD